MVKDTLVSVIIPAYNADRWIADTIRSVLAQTYRNLEIIVVDDGSPDEGYKRVQEFAKGSSHIHLIRQNNQGLPSARNTGIRAARGQFIAPLDADDLWREDKLEKQLQRYYEAEKEGEAPGLVYCQSTLINERGELIAPLGPGKSIEGRVFDELLFSNFIGNGSAPLIPTSIAREVGLYCEEMKLGCEDWEFYLRIAATHSVAACSERMVFYRQHSSSMSADISRMITAHEMMLSNLSNSIDDYTEKKGAASQCIYLLLLIIRPSFLSWAFVRNTFAVIQHRPSLFFHREVWFVIYQLISNKLKRT